MNSLELNKRLKVLGKECENIKHERKLLATEYDNLTELVKKCGIICIVCLVLHSIVLAQFMKSKSVSVIGLGRFLSPFVFIIFIGSFIVFMLKGFDLFLNADTKYSKMLAEKLNKASATDALKSMNETIMTLESEINRIENEIYEMGGKIEDIEEEITRPADIIQLEEVTGTRGITAPEEITGIEDKWGTSEEMLTEEKSEDGFTGEMELMDLLLNRSSVIEQVQVKNSSIFEKKATENVDDILSALDAFDMDDDDEFENSSELWKKDAMKRYSKI